MFHPPYTNALKLGNSKTVHELLLDPLRLLINITLPTYFKGCSQFH